jgi:hypothetical protein
VAQTFRLKLITERAAGGDPIVRERDVAGPEATIGRAATNDIVLADLAVDPSHAKMRFSGPGRVTIESVGGLPFTVDGKSTSRIDLDVSRHPVASFGEYRLAFEPAEDGGATVTVTRESHDHPPSASVFSLQAPVFGRRNMAWALAAGIFLLCLLVPLTLSGIIGPAKIRPDQQWSSGALTKAHSFLESDCKSCHVKNFQAVRDDSCLTCHKSSADPAPQFERARSLGSPFQPQLAPEHAAHDKLEEATPLPAGLGAVSAVFQRALGHPTDRCASCHIEHTKSPKPEGAGAKAPPLSDKPKLVVVQDCQSCHSQLKMRLTKTELIDTPDWNKHPGFRPLVMTSAAGAKPTFQRVALNTTPQERNGLTFPHRMHLDPRGGVARQAIELGKAGGYGAPLECASCHRRDAGGKDFVPIEMEQDCGGCHSLAYTREGGQLKNLPHGELQKVVDTLAGRSLMASPGSARQRPGTIRPSVFSAGGASAYRATFSRGGACYDCHTVNWAGDTVQMAPVKLATKYLPRGGFDHSVPEHGGPGTSKAGGFECADCHKAKMSDRASDVLIPDLKTCATCHGQPATKIAAADDADCTTCHSFHKPGQATPKPGHPPLETLRWTQTMAKTAGD